MWWVVLEKVGVTIPAVLGCSYGIRVYQTARSGEKHDTLITFLKQLHLAPNLQLTVAALYSCSPRVFSKTCQQLEEFVLGAFPIILNF